MQYNDNSANGLRDIVWKRHRPVRTARQPDGPTTRHGDDNIPRPYFVGGGWKMWVSHKSHFVTFTLIHVDLDRGGDTQKLKRVSLYWNASVAETFNFSNSFTPKLINDSTSKGDSGGSVNNTVRIRYKSMVSHDTSQLYSSWASHVVTLSLNPVADWTEMTLKILQTLLEWPANLINM